MSGPFHIVDNDDLTPLKIYRETTVSVTQGGIAVDVTVLRSYGVSFVNAIRAQEYVDMKNEEIPDGSG